MAGRLVTLTLTEFKVLRVLSTNAGRAVTYDSLLRQAWGKRERGSAAPTLVRAIVKGLRRKLGDDAARPAYVRNERAASAIACPDPATVEYRRGYAGKTTTPPTASLRPVDSRPEKPRFQTIDNNGTLRHLERPAAERSGSGVPRPATIAPA